MSESEAKAKEASYLSVWAQLYDYLDEMMYALIIANAALTFLAWVDVEVGTFLVAYGAFILIYSYYLMVAWLAIRDSFDDPTDRFAAWFDLTFKPLLGFSALATMAFVYWALLKTGTITVTNWKAIARNNMIKVFFDLMLVLSWIKWTFDIWSGNDPIYIP